MQQKGYEGLIGMTFGGRYLISEELGVGSMGAVFLAHDNEQQNLPVAVKMLDPVLLAEPSLREELIKRFQREVAWTQALEHPNIVKLFDSGTHDEDKLYLVLELLDGFELGEILGEPVPSTRVSRIAQQIASALAVAHEKGIVHRDLKPENVLLVNRFGHEDVVKVVDFGIARMMETHNEVTAVTKAGTTLGTPRYMAPEQAMAQTVSPMTDLYSLGVIIYELLTGYQLFYAETDMMLALSHVNEPVPELVVPSMAEEELAQWQGLLTALLQKDPAHRPQAGAEVVEMLQQITPGLGDPVEQIREAEASEPAIRVQPVKHPSEASSAGGPAPWMLAAGAALVVGVIVAVILAVT